MLAGCAAANENILRAVTNTNGFQICKFKKKHGLANQQEFESALPLKQQKKVVLIENLAARHFSRL